MSRYQELLEQYSREHMKSVYYFCLKKTSDAYEAEELAADITSQIAERLQRGDEPEQLRAWVWAVARNRYSAWVKRRAKDRDAIIGSDIGEMDISSARNVESDAEQREQLSLLRRELAFTAHDYREIVVEFYIGDRRVSDIAKTLSLPEGTVKRRLFEARRHLKEGMNMSREFGPKSYKPENVRFLWVGGSWFKPVPTKEMERKIPKNLLLETSDNPSTLEELAIALGIALPYIEDEVRLMVDKGFLREKNGRYTAIPYIADIETQEKVYTLVEETMDEQYMWTRQAALDSLPALRRLAEELPGTSDADLMWNAIALVQKTLQTDTWKAEAYEAIAESERGWHCMGFEDNQNRKWDSDSGGLHKGALGWGMGRGNEKPFLWGYFVPEYGLPFKSYKGQGEKTIGAMIDDITERFEQNPDYKPDLLTFRGDALEHFYDEIRRSEAYKLLLENDRKIEAQAAALLRRLRGTAEHEFIEYDAHTISTAIKPALHAEFFRRAVNDGTLTLPENPADSRVTMYIVAP